MAINPDGSRKNRNTLIIATTGGGKSQAAKNLIPGRGVRFIAFDPEGEHPAHGIDSFPAFCRELMKADRSGRPYRLAYTGGNSDKDFERFCKAVWDVLDGSKETHVLLEEVAQFTKTSGPAMEQYGNLLRRGRKYGAIIYTIGQRAAEIPSTARQQSTVRYVGLVDGEDDAKAAAKYADVTAAKLLEIPPHTLTFYRKETGYPAEKMQFKYLG